MYTKMLHFRYKITQIYTIKQKLYIYTHLERAKLVIALSPLWNIENPCGIE